MTKIKMKIRHDLDFCPCYIGGKDLTDPDFIVAEIVDVAPHLANIATFVLHESIEANRAGYYQISNLESGGCISRDLFFTRCEAIARVRAILHKKTEAEMLMAYKRTLVK